MLKAISEEQIKSIGCEGCVLTLDTEIDALWDSLEPCYTKKQIEEVLENIENSNIDGATMAIIMFKKELEKLDGE